MCRPTSIVEAGSPKLRLAAPIPKLEVGAALAGPADDAFLQASSGPPEASEQIEELYRQHSPALVRHLARRTGCSELARELAE